MIILEAVGRGFSLHEQPIAEGEIILLGPNGSLAVEVIAVRGEKAWVRDLEHGRDGVVDLANFSAAGPSGMGGLQ